MHLLAGQDEEDEDALREDKKARVDDLLWAMERSERLWLHLCGLALVAGFVLGHLFGSWVWRIFSH